MRGCPHHSSALGSEITSISLGSVTLSILSRKELAMHFHSRGMDTHLSLARPTRKTGLGLTVQQSPTLRTDKFSVWIKAEQCHVLIIKARGF